MADQSNDNTPHDADGSSAFDAVTDLVTGTSIPAPIRKNFFKAFSRLCSASIDIPAAYLEGKASEIRAEYESRIKIMSVTSEQIAEQMRVDPEYARTAAKKFGERIIREQVNLDMISEIAAKELKKDNHIGNQPSSEETINDDWMNTFETRARLKSTDDMQQYFGRVLAGEIRSPNSFSVKTVEILSNFDQEAAKTFRRLCSLSMIFQDDVRVTSLGGQAGDNCLSKYGLDYGQLNVLNEHGLIISDYNSWKDYQGCRGIKRNIPNGKTILVSVPFMYQGKYWLLASSTAYNEGAQFKLHGVALTRSGMELKQIIDIEPVDQYTQDLIAFFQNKNLVMTEAPDDSPHIKMVD